MISINFSEQSYQLIFQGIGLADAVSLVQKMLEDFRNLKFNFTDQPITFSAGVTEYRAGVTFLNRQTIRSMMPSMPAETK